MEIQMFLIKYRKIYKQTNEVVLFIITFSFKILCKSLNRWLYYMKFAYYLVHIFFVHYNIDSFF